MTMERDRPQSAASLREQLTALEAVIRHSAADYCRARRNGEPRWAVEAEARFVKCLFRQREVLKWELRKAEAREGKERPEP